MGHAGAMASLEEPPFPEALRYLQKWLYEVHGRSGASMGGLAPLSYGCITEWMALTGADPTGYEVEALLLLDAVLRHPEEMKPNA